MLQPKGCDTEIDVAEVCAYLDPGYKTQDNEQPEDVVLIEWSDPYTEDYSAKRIIRDNDLQNVALAMSDDDPQPICAVLVKEGCLC